MSHLRDIQRLRQTKNLEPLTLPPRSTQYRPVDIYNINFDKMSDLDTRSNSNNIDLLTKYVQSKDISSTHRDRRNSHKRGTSNATNEPESPGLSM